MGWAARATAKRRAAGTPAPDPYPHVTREEQDQIRASWAQQAKRMRGVPGRRKREWADTVTQNALAQLEAQRVAEAQQVKPVTQGLIVPQRSLLVTPEEVRQMARVGR